MERRNRYSGRSNSSNFFWRYAKVFGARLSNSARPVPRPSEGMTIEWVEIRDRFRERREGEIYSSLVLLELVVGEEGIAGIAWTLLWGNADGIRLAEHRRRLTANPRCSRLSPKRNTLSGFARTYSRVMNRSCSTLGFVFISCLRGRAAASRPMRSSCRSTRRPVGEGLVDERDQ